METSTSFKTFMYWGNETKAEVRRFFLEEAKTNKFSVLQDMIRDLYHLTSQKFTIAWKDDDGDEILMSSDYEVKTMLSECPDNVLKLIVRCADKKGGEQPSIQDSTSIAAEKPIPKEQANTILHQGVFCDECKSTIAGHRYKCLSCDNYDLCGNCENAGKHPEHCVVRVPNPTLPIPLIKASIKKSRRFLKTVALTQAQDETKKHRRERKQAEPTSGKQESQPRAARNWVDVLGRYIEEFANLAGDLASSTYEAATNAQSGPSTAQPSPSNVQPGPSTSKPIRNEQFFRKEGFSREDLEQLKDACQFAQENDMLLNRGELNKVFKVKRNADGTIDIPVVAELLNLLLNNKKPESTEVKPESNEVEPDIESEDVTPKEESPKVDDKVESKPSTSQETPESGVATEDLLNITIYGQDEDTPESKKFYVRRKDMPLYVNSKKNPMSSNASSCSSEGNGSDKGDGWTVLDPETSKDEGGEPEQDKPEESQDEPTGHAPIYPALNLNTAVLNPTAAPFVVGLRATPAGKGQPKKPQGAIAATLAAVEAEMAQAEAKAKAAKADAAAKAKAEATAKAQAAAAAASAQAAAAKLRRNLAPHIEAAIRQMELMGFSNESGWLTQLLVHNDGNIATVLDLITPNAPK